MGLEKKITNRRRGFYLFSYILYKSLRRFSNIPILVSKLPLVLTVNRNRGDAIDLLVARDTVHFLVGAVRPRAMRQIQNRREDSQKCRWEK